MSKKLVDQVKLVLEVEWVLTAQLLATDSRCAMVEMACTNAPFTMVSVSVQAVHSGLDQSEAYSVWRTVATLVLYRTVLSRRMP
jgi:hypothetical protein